MKFKKRIPLAAFFLLPCLAFAHLGDTPDELVKRIGVEAETSLLKPALTETSVYQYEKDGVLLVAYFWHGKSCQETYSKKVGKFSDEEINTFLKSNSFGGEWNLLSKNFWEWTSNGTRVMGAGVSNSGDFSMFTTKFMEAYLAAEAAAQKNHAKDF